MTTTSTMTTTKTLTMTMPTSKLEDLSSVTAFLRRLFVGDQFDEIVDPQDSNGGFGGELEAFDLADGGFEDSGFEIVSDDALDEIESDPPQFRVLFVRLRRVVKGSKF